MADSSGGEAVELQPVNTQDDSEVTKEVAANGPEAPQGTADTNISEDKEKEDVVDESVDKGKTVTINAAEGTGVGKDQENGRTRRDSVKQKTVLRQGNLKVKQDGQMVYKKTPSQAIMSATQLGIGYSVGRLTAKPERDVLIVDFYFVEKIWFPASGSKETPSHKYDDFRFKSYAPVAFRYFRDIFGILPSDFLMSLSNEDIREISNPGASGSLFFLSNDDMFIVKTVQHKEATFLQQLLPGYYMNLHQNPRTLLPKFFGLYCYQSGSSNIRLTVMNNLLPSRFKCHMKFDLKGSTYKRKASKAERAKKSPTLKDLDFMDMFPEGILLDAETYDAVIKTISRDVRVLESFQIMDYSFLLGLHSLDKAEKEKELNSPKISRPTDPERAQRRSEFGAALEAINIKGEVGDEARPVGGINAKTKDGERLILFLGIIDILQSYRIIKKMEHGWKSMFTDGDTVSVHKPSFYAKRFLDFIKDRVFKRVGPVTRGYSKKKSMKQSTSSAASANSNPQWKVHVKSGSTSSAGEPVRTSRSSTTNSAQNELSESMNSEASTSGKRVRIITPSIENLITEDSKSNDGSATDNPTEDSSDLVGAVASEDIQVSIATTVEESRTTSILKSTVVYTESGIVNDSSSTATTNEGRAVDSDSALAVGPPSYDDAMKLDAKKPAAGADDDNAEKGLSATPETHDSYL